jgi:benzoyl-CoA reductase subunit B
MVAQFHSLIGTLERVAGSRFDLGRLRTLMEGVNRQEEYFEEVREMICSAPKAPVRMHEQATNVMAAQWLRGSDWAIAHACAFRDEVKERVDRGVAACPSERLRLMWVGAGLWHDTDFYTAFEEKHGAVFVWSMYLAFGLYPLWPERPSARARKPDRQLQRTAAQSALGRRVDCRSGDAAQNRCGCCT